MRYNVPDLDPGQSHQARIEIEKSHFIALIVHIDEVAAANALLTSARQLHPTASHHCLAYLAGPPGEQVKMGFSDDGEPGGTAGRPMFQVLEGSGIGEIGCVVVRYFGGVKLGTGGLARAYALAVSEALAGLATRQVVIRRFYVLHLAFAQEADARRWCQSRDLTIARADYHAKGVDLEIGWPSDEAFALGELESRLKAAVAVTHPPSLPTGPGT